MATVALPQEAEKPAALFAQPDEAPAPEKSSVAPAEQTDVKHVAPEKRPAAVPAPLSDDEKIPVEAQIGPYFPPCPSPGLAAAAAATASAPVSPIPTTQHSFKTANTPPPPLSPTLSSSDTDKITVPSSAAMGQYPNDPSAYSNDPSQQLPVYPDHTGSTSPHQQYNIQPDHAYGQPQYDQSQQQHFAQHGEQQKHQPAQAAPGSQQYRTATPIANLNRAPAPVDCPACAHRALTVTQYQTGNTTHAWAFGVCVLTCFGCIPYLISGTKDVQHKCGKCGVLLATWHRSGSTEVHMHA